MSAKKDTKRPAYLKHIDKRRKELRPLIEQPPVDYKRQMYSPRGQYLNYSLPEIVEKEIEQGIDYYAGQLEALETRLKGTIKILGEVIELLPEETKLKIEEKYGFERNTDA